MRLHVKDEEPRLVRSNSARIAQFGGINAETSAVDGIHRGKCHRHTARRAKKLAPVRSRKAYLSFSTSNDFVLDPFLFRSLRNWVELLVRDGLRRDGQIAAEPCVQIRFAD